MSPQIQQELIDEYLSSQYKFLEHFPMSHVSIRYLLDGRIQFGSVRCRTNLIAVIEDNNWEWKLNWTGDDFQLLNYNLNHYEIDNNELLLRAVCLKTFDYLYIHRFDNMIFGIISASNVNEDYLFTELASEMEKMNI